MMFGVAHLWRVESMEDLVLEPGSQQDAGATWKARLVVLYYFLDIPWFV